MLQHRHHQGTCWVCAAATQRGPRLPRPSCPSSERAGGGRDMVPHLPGTEQAASESGVGDRAQGTWSGAARAGSTALAEQARLPRRTSWMDPQS